MAQNWTLTTSTIGTASRNFIDPTTWDAAFPADLRTGNGVHHFGFLFADSDITDVSLTLGPATTTNVSQACNVTMTNAPGQKPVWKPVSGGAVAFFLTFVRGAKVVGITFDGSLRSLLDSSRAIIDMVDQGGSADIIELFGCTVKNSSAHGIRWITVSGGIHKCAFVQVFDCAGSGLLMRDSTSTGKFMGVARYCGFGFNTRWGVEARDGLSQIGPPETVRVLSCWFRGNTLGSIESVLTQDGGVGSSFCVLDDGQFTTLGMTLSGSGAVNVLENATQVQFAFVNEAGRDFTPGSGSVLLGQGHAFGQSFTLEYPFDVNTNRLILNWGDRLDVGPIQSKISAAATVGTSAVSACMEAIRDIFINSTNLTSWIQSINASETTAGHVTLGYDPRTIAKIEQTDGPNVFIYLASVQASNESSEKTYRDICQVVAEVVWFQDQLLQNTFVTEVDFIFGIIEEAKAKGINLTTNFGGEIFDITTTDSIRESPNDRIERRTEINFFVRTGKGVA